jgi:uncharacterized protein YacL
MPCLISCSISVSFIIGMIYFYWMTDKSTIVKEYKSKLPSDLQNRYEKIAKERMAISLQGFLYGFILSLFLIFYNIRLRKEKMNTTSIVCLVMSTCFITNYFYYVLTPKSDYILNHTNSSEQVKAWLQMYKEMQYNYHMGIVLGIVGTGFLSFAFCNK